MFIVIEGIDGAGTTTQAQRLADYYNGIGQKAIFTHEPSEGEFGVLVRSLFTRNDGKPLPTWQVMGLLFTADRLDHLKNVIEPALAEGTTVFCDRYYHSLIGYQSLSAKEEGSTTSEQDEQWLKLMNFHVRQPDAVLVLDVPFETAQARDSKVKSLDKYASQYRLQKRLAEYYSNLHKHFPFEIVLHIDGTQPVKAVTEEILHKLGQTVATEKMERCNGK